MKLRPFVPLIILLLSFGYFAVDLDQPAQFVFDERVYVIVAKGMTEGDLNHFDWFNRWPYPMPKNWEHPPVAKYGIAAGYWLFGTPHSDLSDGQYYAECSQFDNPECVRDVWSWRLGSAIVAALGVLGIYWIGERLFHRQSAGFLAAGLLQLDPIYYIHAHVAMLEAYQVGFTLLAFGVALGPSRTHPWVAGALYGLAIASKHSALFLAPVFLYILWNRNPELDVRRRAARTALQGLVVPASVYLLAFLPYFIAWYRMSGLAYALQTFVFTHQSAFGFGFGRERAEPHPEWSPPESWIPMTHPTRYWFDDHLKPASVARIFVIGNPILWWGGSLLLITAWVTFLRATWQRRGREEGRPRTEKASASYLDGLGPVMLLFVFAYLPYFLLARGTFNYYFLQAACFLSLALAGPLSVMWDAGGKRRKQAIAFLAVALFALILYWPVVAGIHISPTHLERLMGLNPFTREWR